MASPHAAEHAKAPHAMAKFFMCVCRFYQLVSQITTVYQVHLTGTALRLYEDSIAVMSWATFEWDGASAHTHTSRDIMYSSVRVCVSDYFVPGQCIPFGFRTRLLLRAILPLVLLVAILLGTIVIFYCRRARGLSTHSRWMSDALMVSAPIALFGSFILCPTVSKGIFDTWDCTEYELDSATGEMRTFLNSDLQIVCSGNEHPDEYDTIKIIAYIFVLLWPIGMPVIFLLVLWPNRKALRQRRSTRMVQATSFLHKEYDPSYFWWEVVSLAQRLILTGWVLLIPVEYDAWRIFLGLLTSIGCD